MYFDFSEFLIGNAPLVDCPLLLVPILTRGIAFVLHLVASLQKSIQTTPKGESRGQRLKYINTNQ